jgi:hypothetical protein
MRTFLTRLRARARRAHLLAVAAAAVAVSLGIVLTLASTAQAHSESSYLQPAPVTQPLQAWSGNPDGQTSSPASYASVLCVGSTAYIGVHLIWTNQRRTTFQPVYALDAGSWTWTGDTFTIDGSGTGSGTFTLDGLGAGNHQLNLDINTVPGAGITYYLNETRNNGGNVGIYFACPS